MNRKCYIKILKHRHLTTRVFYICNFFLTSSKSISQYQTNESQFHKTENQFHINESQFCKNEIQVHIKETQFYKNKNKVSNTFYIAFEWTQVFELVKYK